MVAQLIAFLIVTPFALVFIYAGVHEVRRFRSKGRANYGLVFDEETGTSHVTGIAAHEDPYDPTEFDPSDHNDRDNPHETGADGTRSDETKSTR